MSQSLHDLGWRQGAVFNAELDYQLLRANDAGEIVNVVSTHERWIVATQDCDLHVVEPDIDDPCLELRLVRPIRGGLSWGIRSRKLRLDDSNFVDSIDAHLHISPRALVSVSNDSYQALSHGRALAFKTWLGLRYDRPAVPEVAVPLAKSVANAFDSVQGNPLLDDIHDLLMQFDLSADPIFYTLIAVITDNADRDSIRSLVSKIALTVPSNLGIAKRLEAVPRQEVTLEVIENSYSADVSAITWKSDLPRGAT